MGPISMADMVGLDLFWKARKAKGNPKAETKVSMGPFDLGDYTCKSGIKIQNQNLDPLGPTGYLFCFWYPFSV